MNLPMAGTGVKSGAAFVTWPEGSKSLGSSGLQLRSASRVQAETGGTILFPAHTTTILTDSVVLTKPHVTLRGEGWETVILRDERAGPCLLELGGVHSTVANITIDGNGEHCTNAKVEQRMKGDVASVRHIQVKKARKMGIGLRSNGGLMTDCLITDLGPKGLSSYGIWAIADTTVSISGNSMRDTFIDGIGLN